MSPQDPSSMRTTAPPAPSPTPMISGMPAPTETVRTSIFLPPLLPGQEQGPQLPSALNSAPTAYTLMRAFQRRWPLAIGMGLLMAALTAAVVVYVFPAKYVTYYLLKINNEKGNPLGDVREDPEFNVFKMRQAALAKTRQVVQAALNMQEEGRYIKDLGIIRASGDPVDWINSALKTDFILAPEIMKASLGADNPEEVKMLLNALAKALVEENKTQDENKHKAQVEDSLAKSRLLQADIDRQRRLYNQRLGALGPNAAAVGKRFDQLDQEKRDASKAERDKGIEIAGLKARIEQVTKRVQNPELVPVPEKFIADQIGLEAEAAEYLQAISRANTEYNHALKLIDVNSPQMAPYIRQKDNAERAFEGFRRRKLPDIAKKYREFLASEGAAELRKLEGDLDVANHQHEILRANVERIETEMRQMRPGGNLPPDVVSLLNEIESSELALKRVFEQIQFMKISVPPSRVSILQEAIEPGAKDTSRQMKLAGAGSIGMFILTVLGISFLEFRSRKITSSDEVKRGLGLTVIGTIPTLPDKARSPIAQTKLDPYWQNQIMESVDTIRTMLLHNARSNNTRVIMVTSAVGGEGKTSLASQLAASLARAWKKTLLIDGDLRNPTTHKIFDIPQEPGLSEVLRGELSGVEAVRSTPLSRLWVLPAGHWDSHAVQALAQDNIRTMLEELKQQYDFIVLDSCPVLPVADSLLLGQNVDGVLMTVMREVSRSPAVYAAHQRLESLGIKTLGAVVIGAKNELGPMGYKYAYQGRP